MNIVIEHHLLLEVGSLCTGVINTVAIALILYILIKVTKTNLLLDVRLNKISFDTNVLIVDKQKNIHIEFENTIDGIYNRVLEKINILKVDSDKLTAFISKKYEILGTSAKAIMRKEGKMTKEEFKGYRTNCIGKHIYIIELKRQWLGDAFTDFTITDDDMKLQRVLDKIENVLFSPTNNKTNLIKIELLDYITDVLNVLVATWNKFKGIGEIDKSKLVGYRHFYSINKLDVLFKMLLCDIPMINDSYEEVLSLCSQYNENEKNFTLGTIGEVVYTERLPHIKERLIKIINKLDE